MENVSTFVVLLDMLFPSVYQEPVVNGGRKKEEQQGTCQMSGQYRMRIPHSLDPRDKDRILPPLDPKRIPLIPLEVHLLFPTRPRLLALNVGGTGG